MAAVRTWKTTTIVASGAAQRVLGPNDKRVGLIVCTNSNSLSAFRFGDAPAGTGDGIILIVNSGPFVLWGTDIGPTIKASVNLFGTAAAQLSFTEILEDNLTLSEIGGS